MGSRGLFRVLILTNRRRNVSETLTNRSSLVARGVLPLFAQGPLGIVAVRQERPLAGPLQAHVRGHLVDHGHRDDLGLQGECSEQKIVAHGVD